MVFDFLRRNKRRRPESLLAVGVVRNAFAGAQRHAIEKWCDQNGARIIVWVEEDFPFGTPWHRPELENWLTGHPPRRWDVIVAHGMERLTAIDLLEWCRGNGKRLVLAEERGDSDKWLKPSTLAPAEQRTTSLVLPNEVER